MDLVIRNADIADGSGRPLVRGDLAVVGGRIAAIGDVAARGREEIDGTGLVLAPGIIDVHTHYDAQLTWDVTASPSPTLGVTTAVMGNCGFTIAPCPAAMRDLVARNLSEVEGMPLDALIRGIDWSFESFGDYLDLLTRRGAHLNVAGFVGHSTVRTAVMGEAASTRAATAGEIEQMRTLVDAALAAGAVGLSSSASENHSGFGGVPMPSRLASEAELRHLAAALGAAGRGIFQMTAGPATPVSLLESIARDTGRPVIFSSVFQNDVFPERGPGQLAACAEAQARGAEVWGQVSCQPLTMDFTLANPYPMHSLDAWTGLKAASREELIAVYSDPAFRDRLRQNLANPKRGTLFYGKWERVRVMATALAHNAPIRGRSIADLAAQAKCDPLDFFLGIALDEDLDTVFTAQLVNTDETGVADLLRHPCGVIALSDAGAHLSFLCDAGYGLHLLGHWVRELGALSLAEAVRKLTSMPATIYGISGRGRLAPGYAADLLLIDPRTVGSGPPLRRHDLPGRNARMIREPVGVVGVWVNGEAVARDGRPTTPSRPPGEILRRFAV